MPDPPIESLEILAAGITLNSNEFGAIYDPLARKKGGTPWMVLNLDTSKTRYFNALEQASGLSFFNELIWQIIEARGTNATDEVKTELQAWVSPELGMYDSVEFDAGSAKARRRLCKIHIDPAVGASSSGTGFLIGPQAVLTNWHVVEPLTNDGVAIANSNGNIKVEFDHNSAANSKIVKVAEDWLMEFSRYHPAENPQSAALDFTQNGDDSFAETLDFAVIQLAEAEGLKRNFYRLDPLCRAQPGAPGSQVTVFQHPGGGKLKHAPGAATALWPQNVETRLQHTANTQKGSSGGLVADSQLRPIGLHQSSIEFDDESVINCAIPTCMIANKLPKKVTSSSNHLLLDTQSGYALIDRKQLQNELLDVAQGKPQILNLPTEKAPRVAIDLIATMTDPAENVVLEFPAEHLPNNSRTFAIDLLSRIAPTDGSTHNLPDADDRKTAEAAWLKDVLWSPFVTALGNHAENKTIWLIITGLEAIDIFGRPKGHLLEHLLLRIASLPFVRLVLVGQSGLPIHMGPTQLTTVRSLGVTRPACIDYITRKFVESEWDDWSAEVPKAIVDAAFEFQPTEQKLAEVLFRTANNHIRDGMA